MSAPFSPFNFVSMLPLLSLATLLMLAVLTAHALLLRQRGLAHLRRHLWLGAGAALLALATLAASLNGSENLPATGQHPHLPWLLLTLILSLLAIIQQFSSRFLLGEPYQSACHFWLHIAACASALCWLSADLRLLLASWAIALYAMQRLIGIVTRWPAAQHARRHVARYFVAAWLALALPVLLHACFTPNLLQAQSWSLTSFAPATWPEAARHLAAVGLLLALLISAAQWPFQRWLMTSMVAPTPVSALMHAGFVNIAALLLLIFAPLLHQVAWLQPSLILLCAGSLILASGMLLVQVDIKRQLAASTVAQMAGMLLQCALGAYVAALLHLLLHSTYKASLFLHAGSAVKEQAAPAALAPSGLKQLGLTFILALMLAPLLVTTMPANHGSSAALSALLLAATLAQTLLALRWRASLSDIASRAVWRNLSPLALVLLCLFILHDGVSRLLAQGLPSLPAPNTVTATLTAGILLGGTWLLQALRQHSHLPLAQQIYWRLLGASEAHTDSIDSHPRYLARQH